MPQLVALFNGVGGGAAALVALLELHEIVDARPTPSAWFELVATAFTILVGAVSFSGSLVTFAKLQELMTTRPVVFPGLPIVFGGVAARRASRCRSCWSSDPTMWIGIVLGAARPAARRAAGAAGRRRRRADRDLAAQRVHRSDRRGRRLRARQHLLLVAGTLVGASGTFLTKLMAEAMGRSVANILFGALKGGSTLGAGEASDRPVRSRRARGRRDPARLRPPGDHRARLRARGRAGPAHAARAGRRARRARASRSTTRSTRSPAGCPAT